jgi:hypothetical protein
MMFVACLPACCTDTTTSLCIGEVSCIMLAAKSAAAFADNWLTCCMLWCVLQSIMVGLKQSDDESAQLTALTDLCEHLSISTEESLATFPVEQVVPLLVSRVACSASTCCSSEGCFTMG